MASKQSHKRLNRAITPEVDNDFLDMMEEDPKVIAARQQIEEANNAHMQRKDINDIIQNLINKNIAQLQPEKDRLQKEKGILEKELSKSRGTFRGAPSCNNLQEQLWVLDEQIKIHDKKISNASRLTLKEKKMVKAMYGGRRKSLFKKSLFKKSLFKKKRIKRRTKKRRSRKRRKTKRRIYKVRKTRRKLKGGVRSRWAKLKKKKAMRNHSQLPPTVIQNIPYVKPTASRKEKENRKKFVDAFVFKEKLNTETWRRPSD